MEFRLVLDSSFKLGDDIVYRIVDGEAFVLDVGRGEHFSLNRIATEILKFLDEGKSCREILNYQTREYGKDREALHSDLAFFIAELTRKGIVVN